MHFEYIPKVSGDLGGQLIGQTDPTLRELSIHVHSVQNVAGHHHVETTFDSVFPMRHHAP